MMWDGYVGELFKRGWGSKISQKLISWLGRKVGKSIQKFQKELNMTSLTKKMPVMLAAILFCLVKLSCSFSMNPDDVHFLLFPR